MNFSIRSLLIGLSLCGIAAAVIASELHHRKRMRNETCQMAVAWLVCDYLDANQRQWPQDWDALQSFYDARFPNETSYSFAEFKDRVLVDFTIDGTELLAICVNPKRAAKFDPIRSIYGDNPREENPNLAILNHVGRMICYVNK